MATKKAAPKADAKATKSAAKAPTKETVKKAAPAPAKTKAAASKKEEPKAAPAKGKAKPAPKPERKPLTQAALIDRLAAKSGATKVHVKAILDELAAVAGSEAEVGFTIPSIGKISVRETQERQGRNPATGEAMTIPAGKRVKFSAAAVLKRSVEGK